MKVLLITGEYPPMRGGVADYTAILAKALAEQGCRVSVLTSQRAKSAAEHVGPDPREETVSILPSVGTWGAEAWRRSLPVVDQLRPDVVHVQYQTGAFGMRIGVNLLPWLIRGRASRPKVLVTFHDLKEPYLLPKIGQARHLATAALASGSDAVVVTNHEDFDQVGSVASPDRTRPLLGRRLLRAIPIGSNILRLPDNFDRDAWRAQLGARRDDIVVGFFGFLVPSKGLETLIAAFEDLLAQDRPIRLAMIGASAGDTEIGGDSYATEIRRLLGRPGIQDRVSWTDFASEPSVAAYLQACDLACLPFREGASLRHGTLAAAIVQGLPIVTTRSDVAESKSGLPRLRDGENAVLVSPGEKCQLARALSSVVDDASLRDRLRVGIARVAAQLDWKRIASQHVDLYCRIVTE